MLKKISDQKFEKKYWWERGNWNIIIKKNLMIKNII